MFNEFNSERKIQEYYKYKKSTSLPHFYTLRYKSGRVPKRSRFVNVRCINVGKMSKISLSKTKTNPITIEHLSALKPKRLTNLR